MHTEAPISLLWLKNNIILKTQNENINKDSFENLIGYFV